MVSGPGVCRGGIIWNDMEYRVMGDRLVSIYGTTITDIGQIPGTGRAVMTIGFDHLAIAADENLFFYNGSELKQNTDPDLGKSLAVVWIDGYFMTTDGQNLVVTELGNPFSVNPLKYGSSERDPDDIMTVLRYGVEVAAINRHSIETFYNAGTANFPFQRNDGAYVNRGAIGPYAACVADTYIAFVGGGRNEPIGVYMATNGSSQKVSTREIDLLLEGYTNQQLQKVLIEYVSGRSERTLMIHLPDVTVCFDIGATEAAGQPIWYYLTSAVEGLGEYRAQYYLNNSGKWTVADTLTPRIGCLSDEHGHHWGEQVGWEFSTPIIYNDAKGAVFHSIELVGMPGSVALGENPVIETRYSEDGVTWSSRALCKMRTIGNRTAPIKWLRQGMMRDRRIQKFSGTSEAHISVAALEAEVEGLTV